MPLSQLLFSFNGRINRGKFWLGVVLTLVFSVVASVVLGLLAGFATGASGAPQAGQTAGLLIGVAVGILGAVMQFALMVKRCHDRGKSGWWSLIAIIPLVGLIWMIVDLGVLEGEAGPNAYGPDPLGGSVRTA